jgi:hypothetical protein
LAWENTYRSYSRASAIEVDEYAALSIPASIDIDDVDEIALDEAFFELERTALSAHISLQTTAG